MTWFFLIAAIVLVALGVDALLLTNRAAPLTDRELDELVVGREGPPLPDASKNLLRRDVLRVSLFLYPQWLGVTFLVAGILCAALAIQLWHSSI